MNAVVVETDLETRLPLNLAETVGARTLMRMVFEAVDNAGWPQADRPPENGAPEPVLRTLVAYCYSCGIFSSLEIESRSQLDCNVRYLSANDHPTWQQLRQFRRANGKRLEETIARVLQAVTEEIGQIVPFSLCVVEAARRLQLAIQADSAAMDI